MEYYAVEKIGQLSSSSKYYHSLSIEISANRIKFHSIPFQFSNLLANNACMHAFVHMLMRLDAKICISYQTILNQVITIMFPSPSINQ